MCKGLEDAPSLDAAIQNALAGLYPPFEATAPTVLGQVFHLLDADFRGDGLSFLLDFLIPAKRLCEQVREAACAPYTHCLFLHQGWPLCLQDKVVVHLAPLNPLLLRQSDFYLQVEPQEEQSVCIMIKCLSLDLRTVDTKPVPVSSYPTLFTQEWLEAFNNDFEGSPLHNCLVASEEGIVPVPWTKITSPEFVDDKPQAVTVLSPAWGSLQLEALDLSGPQELHQARSPGSQVLLGQSLAKAGTTQTKTSGPAADSGPLAGGKAGFPEASTERGPTLDEEPPGPEPSIRALSMEIIHSRIACLPGGRDRAGRPLLLVSTPQGAWEAPWCTASEVTKLLSYLCTVPRPEDKTKGLAVVIDARKQPLHPVLVNALEATQKSDPFLADLRQASSLLQASIKEFEKGDSPGGAQEASRCLNKSKELMEAVLRDPVLLGLQREGGATLARLQQEASRLDFNPDVRSHLAEATALYSLVDEQLHVLVTTSNHLLGRLELRVRMGRLEAAIHQVSNWMEQEGSRRLQALTPKDGSLETVQKAHLEFEDFFLQAAAQYRQGLELSKQAAQLGASAGGAREAGGTEPPELAAFASTQRTFQAKLTHFYMAAERQRTDLETLLQLYHFCKKMAWFHMDCQDLMTQLRLGKDPKASPGGQRRLHRYLQRLSSEFPAEKLTAMGLQVASLSREDLGQDLWEEAQVRHGEIQTLLTKALAHCSCSLGPSAHAAQLELQRTAAKGQGVNGEVTSKGQRDPPFQDSLGLDRSPKPRWPPRAERGGQNRHLPAGPLPLDAGQATEAGEGKGPREPLDPAPERFLTSLFSWQRLPRQRQVPHPTGGSSSSEGTDSRTSLEDSPQTSPPASL
ncbi:LOW QUALITY PROTEIN: uncharacterized protein KIAA1755 homolog [Myotis lucifugus]|uniref:LOW QUALITY PROTEIN: uncharacterized protein KIAA1755 homolog n=1 Tax=Myotis lucifugus TaxID=59463 RepID=UPI000CCBDF84|nr:LOW QUALITY PROTEIN: uncharacterized protein KIAA1755 homolog [Myotis lucifugus]